MRPVLAQSRTVRCDTRRSTLPSKKLQLIVKQLDAFSDEYLTLDLSGVEHAAAELKGYAEGLECEGI